MDDLRACEILNACYERLFSAPLYASACKVYRRLKTQSVSAQRDAESLSWEGVSVALNHLPVMFLEPDRPDCVQVVMGSGAAKLNPVVVELFLADKIFCVTIWKKKGFLYQKSAQKALEKIMQYVQQT